MAITQRIKDFYTKKKDFVWLFVILIAAFYLISGPSTYYEGYDGYESISNSRGKTGGYAAPMMADAAFEMEESISSYAPIPSNDAGNYPDENKKIRKNGWLTTEVEKKYYQEAKSEVENLVEAYDGFMTNENENRNKYNDIQYMTYSTNIKVPVDKFDAAIDQLKKIGELQNMNVNAYDMTTQYHDQKAEKESIMKLKAKTENLLDRAEEISDILQIENKISEYQRRIDNIESQLTNIDRQTDYSSISITITEKRDVPGAIAEMTGFGELVRNTVRSFDDLFITISDLVAYLLLILVVYLGYKGYHRIRK